MSKVIRKYIRKPNLSLPLNVYMQEIRFEDNRIKKVSFVSVLLNLSLCGGVSVLRRRKEDRRRKTVRDRVGGTKR